MAKTDLGEKRVCAECDAKFFDLKKRPVVCPKCGFSFDPDAATRRSVRKAAPEEQAQETEKEETEATDSDDQDDSETEDEKELSLDGEAPLMGSDDENTSDSDGASGSGLPDGYTEEGVEDDADVLADDEDEDAKLVDEENLDGDE